MSESPDKRDPINPDAEDHYLVYGLWVLLTIVIAGGGAFLGVQLLS